MHEKITSEVFQIGGPYFTSNDDAAVYLVRVDDSAALIDAGCGGDPARLLDNVRECGVICENIKYLLITHCHIDHTGGARALIDILDCRVAAHKLDAVFLESGDNMATAATWYGRTIKPFKVDIKFEAAREEIDLNGRVITAIHVPGHSPGSVVFEFESDGKKVLFGQDVHGPLHPVLKSDQNDYIRSLKKMMALNADILCEGHFGIIRGKDEVRRFIESYL
ncbi:MAG: MBL fold metallo-hydrolase [Deltaproteobacteria bacterium]|nr:MBL fold metallo-hydrolase [Deltaproteobacteria bacterium]